MHYPPVCVTTFAARPPLGGYSLSRIVGRSRRHPIPFRSLRRPSSATPGLFVQAARTEGPRSLSPSCNPARDRYIPSDSPRSKPAAGGFVTRRRVPIRMPTGCLNIVGTTFACPSPSPSTCVARTDGSPCRRVPRTSSRCTVGSTRAMA